MSGCPFHNNPTSNQMPSVMEVLKVSTQALHDAAEGHRFQQSLVKGEVSREHYAAYLGQLFLVHRELESLLRGHTDKVPAIPAVVKAYQYQEPYLLEDLRFYGVHPGSLTPLPATEALLGEVRERAAKDPLALLGFHYVLEGSNNGNKFIAKALAKSFGLTGPEGLLYLDPYGDQQRPYWMAFKADMDAQGFNPAEMRVMAEAAQAMFQGIGAISAEMGAAVAA